MKKQRTPFIVSGILSFITVLFGSYMEYLYNAPYGHANIGAGILFFFVFLPILGLSSIINAIALLRWARSKDRKLNALSFVGIAMVGLEVIVLLIVNVLWMTEKI